MNNSWSNVISFDTLLKHFAAPGRSVLLIFLLTFSAFVSQAQTTRTWALTTGGSWITASNWSPSGVPQANDNVVISGNLTTAINNIPNITLGNLTILGNCTFDAGATSNTITVSGTLTVSAGRTLLADKSRLGIQIASGGTGNIDGTVNMTLNGQGGIFTCNGTLNLGANAVIGGVGTFTLGNGATLGIASVDGISTLGTTGNIRTTTRNFSASANYIYNGTSAQNTGDGLPATLSGSLTVNNPTSVTLINNARTISSGSLNLTQGEFIAGTQLTLGNSTTSASVTVNRSEGYITGTLQGNNWYNVVYTGLDKITGPEIVANGIRNVSVQLDAGSAVTLDANRGINGVLTLTEGNIITGSFSLTLNNASVSSVSGGSASSYVNGVLNRGIAGGGGSYTFPIGTSTAYAPVTVNFGGGTTAGTLSAFTTNDDNSNISSSDINTVRTVNRSWTISKSSGLSTSPYSAIFEWFGDTDASFDHTNAIVGRYNGSSWSYPTVGSKTAASIEITSETVFGTYQIGKECVYTSISGQPTSVSVCEGINANLTVTASGDGELQYEWMKDNEVLAGEALGTLTIGQPGNYIVKVTGECRTATSEIAVISYKEATAISLDPVGGAKCAGDMIEVNGSGEGTVTYQWYQEGSPIAGATGNSFSVTEAGNYTVDVIAECGTETSDAVAITMNTPTSILDQPVDADITYGDDVNFAVNAEGTGDLTYRWQVYSGSGWNNLTNEAFYTNTDGNALNIDNPVVGLDGFKYKCFVSGLCGTVESEVATIKVSKAVLTITPNDESRIYGDNNPVFSAVISGFQNGEQLNNSGVNGSPELTTSATISSGVGTYDINAAIGNLSAANYSFVYEKGSITITPAILTVTVVDADRIYGDVNPDFEVTYTGFKNEEDVASSNLVGAPSFSTTAVPESAVGPYAIKVFKNTLSAPNYEFDLVDGTLDIRKATLEVTAENNSREYGDADPEFSATITGFKNGEDLESSGVDGTPEFTTPALITSPVGDYDLIPSIGGLTSGNYSFNFKNGTYTIIKAPLVITANDASRTYGEANPDLDASITGYKNGEDVDDLGGTPEIKTDAVMTSPAGTYDITASAGTLPDGNYSYTFNTGTLTIGKATLAVSIDSLSKEYGEVNPQLTYNISGYKNGENLSSSGVTGDLQLQVDANQASGVGNYTISAVANTLDAENYLFNVINGNLKIDKATLEITAEDKSRLYGDANPEFTFTVTGFKNGEQLEDSVMKGVPDYTTDADAESNVNTYDIWPSMGGLTSDNYSFNFNKGTLNIQPAPLTVKAKDMSRTYGDENPVFEFEYDGFKNNQDAETSDLQGEAVMTTTADQESGVGDYTITAQQGDLSSSNYQLSFENGVLTIEKAVITVTIENQSRKYGEENPVPAFEYAGFKNSETESTISLTGEILLKIDQDLTTGVGVYPVTVDKNTLAAPNYSFDVVTGSLTIEKAILQVTADDDTREYGDPDPSFSITLTGYKNGEDETLASLTGMPEYTTTATSTSAVGEYEILPAKGTLDAPNYDFEFNNGKLTVTKAPLAVKAKNMTRKYGQENPVFEASYTGFKNNEDYDMSDLSGQAAMVTVADTLSPVALYDIDISAGDLTSNNYELTFEGGELNVTPASIAVTIENKSKVYGEENPELTYVLSGFENGENIETAGVSGTFEVKVDADANSGAGVYPIEVQSNTYTASNYSFDVVPGSLTIEKAVLDITADDQSREYGDPDPSFTFTVAGFKLSDDLNSGAIIGEPAFTTTASSSSKVGTYDINPDAGEMTAANYTFNFIKGTLTITPATLTVKAKDVSREYGEENPVFEAEYSGFKNNEDFELSDLEGEPSLTTNADLSTDVGDHVIAAASGTLISDNYTINYTDGTLTITKAKVLVTANDATRIYGATDPVFSATYTGFKNNENIGSSGITGSPSLTTTAVTTSNVGEYPIIADAGQLVSTNYDFEFANGILTITKATLTVTADNKAKTYGSANPALTISYVGLISGQALAESDVTGTATIQTTAELTSDAGTYPITFDIQNLASNNYDIIYREGTLTINKANITVQAALKTREYGDENPEFTYSLNGYVLNQTLETSGITGEPLLTTTATSSSNAGTYAITPTIGTLAAVNYAFVMSNGTLTVTKAVLTVTADDKFRNYGAANPAFTATFTGFKLGQTQQTANLRGNPNFSTLATAASPVGEYTIVITEANLGSQNYTFSMVNGVLTINKATVTVSANNFSRAYGNQNPTFTASYTGFVNGQTFATSGITGTPSLTTSADSSSDVGAYPITTGEGTLAASNYTFAFTNGTLTITKAVVNVAADTKIKIYGDANPVFTATYTGFKLGQDITTSGITGTPGLTTTATQTSNVGTYPITASVGSMASSNYSFTFTNGSLIIGKASLLVTADDKSKIYGAANPALTVTYSGFKLGQTLGTSGITGTPSVTTTATVSSAVGTYPINIAQATLASTNYAFTFVNGTLTVSKAILNVTAENKTRAYGASNPALTFTYSGFVGGQTLATSGVTGSPSLVTTAEAASPVGTYPITISEGSLAAANYSFNFVNGSLTVTKASITITAVNRTKIYGEPVPAMSYAMTGFVNGEELLTSDVKGSPDVATAATQTSPVGIYPISVTLGSLSSDNYTFVFVNGNLVISKATVVVKANNASRAYGAANPAFTATINGFVNGETLANSGITGSPAYTTTAVATSPIGIYPITPSVGTLSSSNYSFSYEPGELTITKAVLTVSADNKSRAYGASNPALTYTVTGFANGQNLASSGVTGSANMSTSADELSPVGTYPITIEEGTLAATNYSFTYVNGSLTVSKAVITVTAQNASRTYGAVNPEFNVTYNGFVNGESMANSGVTGIPALSTSATAASPVGTYPIVPASGSLAAANYAFTFVNGTLTITKAQLTVKADDKSKLFGSANPALTVTYNGFVNGETLANSGVSGTPAVTTTALVNSLVGKYPINVAQGTLASGNYSFSYTAGTLTINMGVTFTKQDPICLDGTDGSVTISALGGNGSSLTYSVDNGQTYQSGATITGLGVGTYKLKIKDADGNESAVADAVLNIEIARWIGSASGSQTARTDWANAANWSNNKVPSAITHVLIPAGFTVNVNGNSSVASVQVAAGSTLNVANGVRLTVAGKCGALPNQ